MVYHAFINGSKGITLVNSFEDTVRKEIVMALANVGRGKSSGVIPVDELGLRDGGPGRVRRFAVRGRGRRPDRVGESASRGRGSGYRRLCESVLRRRGRGYRGPDRDGESALRSPAGDGHRPDRDGESGGGHRPDRDGESGDRHRPDRDGESASRSPGDVDRSRPDRDDDAPGPLYSPPPKDKTSLFTSYYSYYDGFDEMATIPVKLTGRDLPHPITSFEQCRFSENILKLCNYTGPTIVQSHAIPVVLADRDLQLVACSSFLLGKMVRIYIATGSSKINSFPCKQS